MVGEAERLPPKGGCNPEQRDPRRGEAPKNKTELSLPWIDD